MHVSSYVESSGSIESQVNIVMTIPTYIRVNLLKAPTLAPYGSIRNREMSRVVVVGQYHPFAALHEGGPDCYICNRRTDNVN